MSTADCWKEQLDVGSVEAVARELYAEVLPLYRLLHAYVRHRLRLHYGRQLIRPQGHIPAHLLGRLCGKPNFNSSTILNLENKFQRI